MTSSPRSSTLATLAPSRKRRSNPPPKTPPSPPTSNSSSAPPCPQCAKRSAVRNTRPHSQLATRPVSMCPPPRLVFTESLRGAAINMYWLYDLPTWLFGSLTVGVFVAIGLAGLYATRRWVASLHNED